MDPVSARITAIRSLGPTAIAVELAAPESVDATPGQFLRVTIESGDDAVAGFYTISSPPGTDTIELTVDRRPEGTVGRRLAGLSAGDAVTIAGPYGTAAYEGESAVLAIAGGPGVGAALAVTEHAIATGGTAAIVYQDDEPIHEGRLAAIARDGCPVWVCVRETSVRQAVREARTPDQQPFIYGYDQFLAVATDALRAAGGSPETAKIENYG